MTPAPLPNSKAGPTTRQTPNGVHVPVRFADSLDGKEYTEQLRMLSTDLPAYLINATIGIEKLNGIKYGQTFVSFAAGTVSTTAVVSHNLGHTPAAVFVGPVNGSNFVAAAFTYTAQTFSTNATCTTAVTGPMGIVWLALG
jgi:hypothetical protein